MDVLSARDEITTSHLGGPSPYWTWIDGAVVVSDTAAPLFASLPAAARVVDPVAVAQLLEFNYMLGERTLVQSVKRMPWRATLRGDGSILREPPIPHQRRRIPPSEAAVALANLLRDELVGALKGFDRAILMLTGGLDSRVVAAVLQHAAQDVQIEVEAATWGHPQSRDVVYAAQIAQWFGWAHHVIPYDAETLWRNLRIAAVWGGAEVAAIHFHAMDEIRSVSKDAVVIAASFGDSIGRAEYSSVHLSRLKHRRFRNQFGLIDPVVVPEIRRASDRDRAVAWGGAELNRIGRLELDYQENYMRRMISHAFDYARSFCSLHQAFTSKQLVRYMWSIDPALRTDEIYEHLLRNLDERLYGLPWARTGIAPGGAIETNSALMRDYHSWETWVRENLEERLKPLIAPSGSLMDLGFITPMALRKRHDVETILKLAGLAVATEEFDISGIAHKAGAPRGLPPNARGWWHRSGRRFRGGS